MPRRHRSRAGSARLSGGARNGLRRVRELHGNADLGARVTLAAAAFALDPLAIGVLGGLGLLGSVATEVRRSIGRQLAVSDPAGFALMQHLLVWAILPLAAFHASIVWAAALRSSVVWAHVRYSVDRRGRVVAVLRS